MMKIPALFLPFIAMQSFASVQITDSLRLSGFGTWAASNSDAEFSTFQGQQKLEEGWCFDCNTTLGLQLDWDITDNLRSSVQFIKRPIDDFTEGQLEWAFLAYRYQDFTFKAGRLRLPLFMMSEYFYVGQAYPWLKPQRDVYNSVLGVTHYDGAAVEWDHYFDNGLNWRISPFMILPTKDSYSLSDDVHLEVDAKTGFGITNEFFYDEHTFRFAYLHSRTTQKSTLHIPNIPALHQKEEFNFGIYTLGANIMLTDNLALMSEIIYSKDFYHSWYAGLSYNFDKMTPYFNYGEQKMVDKQSLTAGFRYAIRPELSFNAEWQRFYNQNVSNSLIIPTTDDVDVFTLGVTFNF